MLTVCILNLNSFPRCITLCPCNHFINLTNAQIVNHWKSSHTSYLFGLTKDKIEEKVNLKKKKRKHILIKIGNGKSAYEWTNYFWTN